MAAVLAWVLFGLLLTLDGGLLHRDTFGNFYDAQAHSWLHGHWNIEPEELSLEAFIVDGKAYTYFGPVPAVLRLPVEAVTQRFHGRLTRVSMLAAEALLLWFAVRLVGVAWRSIGDGGPPERVHRYFAAVFVFAAGASSTLYLAGKAWVYHEALLWGAALSVGSFALLGEHLLDRRLRHAAWAAVLGGLALLTRASVGAGPMAAIVAVAAWQGWQAWRRARTPAGGSSETLADHAALTRREHTVERAGSDESVDPRATGPFPSLRSVGVLIAGVIASVGVYAAVNLARFNTPFGLPVGKQVVASFDPQTRAALAANHDSLFGAQFFPTQILQSLRPDALETTRLFPFLNYPAHHATVFGDAVFQAVEPASSLTASEPLLFLLALAGIVALVRPRWFNLPARIRVWSLPTLGAAVGAAGYLFVYFVANRYYTDALPFLLVAGAVGALALGTRAARAVQRNPRIVPALAGAILVLLAAFGAWVNASLATEDRYVITDGTTVASRQGWVSWQLRVDDALHGGASLDTARRVQRLPASAARDQLVVLGDCTGLFVSNGKNWRIVEGNGSISARLQGHFPQTADGHSAVLAERQSGAGAVRFLWTTLADGRHRVDLQITGPAEQPRVLESDVVLAAHEVPEGVHVILDANTHQAELRDGDLVLFNAYLPMPEGGQITPGPGLHAVYSSMNVCRKVADKVGGAP